MVRQLVALLLSLISGQAVAGLEIQQVTDHTYALVGPLGQRSETNFGNNATFGVVVTNEGVVLIDPGGSWKGAEEIHAAIKQITDQPVKIVINTGGQDHRWFGNDYWQQKGARTIASEAANADHTDRVSLQIEGATFFLKDQYEGTKPVNATETFAEEMSVSLGGYTFEMTFIAAAHTPGDIFIWVPEAQTIFTGDIVYTERLLGIGSQSSAIEWVETYKAIAKLNATHVVPGHGHATDMLQADADTYDYLINLRAKIAAHIESGGDIIGSVEVDQSAFSYLHNFDQLARRNAQTRVFRIPCHGVSLDIQHVV